MFWSGGPHLNGFPGPPDGVPGLCSCPIPGSATSLCFCPASGPDYGYGYGSCSCPCPCHAPCLAGPSLLQGSAASLSRGCSCPSLHCLGIPCPARPFAGCHQIDASWCFLDWHLCLWMVPAGAAQSLPPFRQLWLHPRWTRSPLQVTLQPLQMKDKRLAIVVEIVRENDGQTGGGRGGRIKGEGW